MKSLVDLHGTILVDTGIRCGVRIDRDLKTVRDRVKDEGDSFLTITLPAYCSDFERSLDIGRIAPDAFLHFKKVGKAGMPAFLQGFLCNVFDQDGSLLKEPSVDCIRGVRQICLFAKKIFRPCSQERQERAEQKFLECESEVDNGCETPFYSTFSKVCDVVISQIVSDTMYEELTPRHGPGSTCERILGNKKFVHKTWHSRLEEVFPFSEFGIASVRTALKTDYERVHFSEPKDEKPVRVVFVPKTLKTPRVIAIEPVCMQYAQQALSGYLVPRIERSRLTAGHVNFTDQTVNQKLAAEGSKNGKLATIDMSEASDRVSNAMASTLYRSAPLLWSIVDASRSRRATLPSGQTIDLRKFASMGSAMCFTTEALVFFCAIVASRIAQRPVTGRLVYELSRDVYVYGDDLIVPADEAPSICADLEAFGLKVNGRKSFWTGKFRESCGKDYYDSSEVTAIYLRRDTPSNAADTASVISSVSTANQLFRAGYRRTATSIKEEVEKVVGRLPTLAEDSGAIGWSFYSEYDPPKRYNHSLQRTERRLLTVAVRRVKDHLVGDPALAKCFHLIGVELPSSIRHLTESVRAGCATLKRRWCSA